MQIAGSPPFDGSPPIDQSAGLTNLTTGKEQVRGKERIEQLLTDCEQCAAQWRATHDGRRATANPNVS
jgi:hypothetical protein